MGFFSGNVTALCVCAEEDDTVVTAVTGAGVTDVTGVTGAMLQQKTTMCYTIIHKKTN